MLGFPEQFLVFMLAHLLFAPLDNASHRLTSLVVDFLCKTVGSKAVTMPFSYPFAACSLLPVSLLNSFAWSMKASSCISVVRDSVPS